MIFRFFKLLFSLFPDLTGFKEMGFKVHTFNGELYVEKKEILYSLKFSQGFEPFNPKLGLDPDFEIPDGVFLVEFHADKIPSIDSYKDDLDILFRFNHQRGKYWFHFNPKLDFSTPQIGVKTEKLIKILERAVKG